MSKPGTKGPGSAKSPGSSSPASSPCSGSHPHTQAPSPAPHTGTWPELACLGKGGQPAAPPQPREPLFAALRRPHPGWSRSCGVEKGGHGHAHPELALPAPPCCVHPDLVVLSSVPSLSGPAGAGAGGQGLRAAGERCRPLLLAVILPARRPRAHACTGDLEEQRAARSAGSRT